MQIAKNLAVILVVVFIGATAFLAAQAPPSQTTGTVSGQVLWTDGAPYGGYRISAIAVREPTMAGQKASGTHGYDWVPGEKVVSSAVTDNTGRFRFQSLRPGRYHIVAGPVSLVKPYDDVTTVNSPHFVTVTPGSAVDGVLFEIVRNPDRIPFDSDRVPFDSKRILTVTGTIGMKTFGSAGGGIFISVPQSDGSTVKWNIRGGYGPGGARYWWPGYQPNMRYAVSPIADMVNAGETVTISGFEPDNWGGSNRDIFRPLMVIEVTRGGR
jgi:hypothetical protein